MLSIDDLRELLARHGTVQPQSERDWAGDFPLPPELRRFYEVVGPVDVTIPGYGNPYFLPSLANLWSFQVGYRWSGSGERIADWNDDWIVVAYEDGDPFIFSRSSGRVFFAQHGVGKWDPVEFLPSIEATAVCLATLGDVVHDTGRSLTDEDCNLRTESLTIAEQLLNSRLGTTEGERLLVVLGWR